MLSIAPIGSASYYLELAREDYFLNGGEPPGKWLGKGADKLGLAEGQTVSREALRSVLAGFHPGRPGEELVGSLRNRQTGWDLTFSVPKSVSVLWSQADPRARSAIQKAQAAAVKAAMGYLESNALETRLGKGGHEHQLAAGGVFAAFEHGTSRAMDPQLHTHVLVANLCLRDDEAYRTIYSLELYRHKMAAGALYRAELARQLEYRLGLETERRQSCFEVKGVPEEVRDYFSQRANEIRELAARYGWSSPEVKARLAEATRQVKGHVDRETAFELWLEQGEKLGFSRREADQLLREAYPHRQQETPLRVEQKNQAAIISAVKERLDERTAYFRERDVVRLVAEEGQGRSLGASDVLQTVERLKEELVLLEDPESLRPFYATPEMVAVEKELLADAEKLRESTGHKVDGEHVAAAIDEVNRRLQKEHGPDAGLTADQMKAVYHIVEHPSDLALVQGLAGTGKTELLTAARIAWERAGYQVIGCAISGKASLGLQKVTGIKSRSLAKTLFLLGRGTGTKAWDATKRVAKTAASNLKTSVEHPGLSPLKFKRQAPAPPESLSLSKKSIVLLDEASMVNTKEWRELQQRVVDAGAKLVAVGDRFQLQSIGAGGPFSSLLDRHDAVQLVDIRRQEHEWMREALVSLAEGDVEYAMDLYASHDVFNVQEDKGMAMAALVLDWNEHRTKKLADTIALGGTNEEVRQLNSKIQQVRGLFGELKWGGVKNAQGETLRGNDRVLFTENSKRLGVFNGDLGTIVNIERPRGLMGPASVHVLLDRKEKKGLLPTRNGPWVPLVDVPRLVKVDLKEYESLTLGYAMTVHKAQGVTVDKAFILGNDMMQDRELTYTQLSRVRDEVKLYLTEAEAGEGLEDFLRQAQKSREKDLAHDVELSDAERYEREHGAEVELHRERLAAEQDRQNAQQERERQEEQERIRREQERGIRF